MNKPHKARKDSDTTILRCILLNINEHVDTKGAFYGIKEERFSVLLDALVKNGIVGKIKSEKPLSTKNYGIIDLIKYEEWSRRRFYRDIDKYVIPLINLATETLKHLPTQQ